MPTDNFREAVLQAAQKLFQQHGWGNVTMEDVARAVGKGKSTLYYYFKSKEEIFDAVLDSEINEVLLDTIRLTSQQNSFVDKLIAFSLVKLEMARKRKSLYRAMETGMEAEERSRFEQVKQNIHRQYVEKEKTVMLQIFIPAMALGAIRQLSGTELQEYILLFLSSIRGINREITIHGTQEDATGLLRDFCQLFFRGLQA